MSSRTSFTLSPSVLEDAPKGVTLGLAQPGAFPRPLHLWGRFFVREASLLCARPEPARPDGFGGGLRSLRWPAGPGPL